MACPVCGNSSPCPHERSTARVVCGEDSSVPLSVTIPGGAIPNHPDDEFWRQEVVSRVQQHRARRRRRFDPHASLELDFQAGMDSYTPEMQLRPPRPVVKAEAPKIIEFPRPASLQPVASLHPVYVPQERLQPSADLELA